MFNLDSEINFYLGFSHFGNLCECCVSSSDALLYLGVLIMLDGVYFEYKYVDTS